MMEYELSDMCLILGEFYMREKQDEDFGEFFRYNDVALPLAYLVASNLAEPTEQGEQYIRETWNMFSEALGLEKLDVVFKTYTQILQFLGNKE